MTVKRYMLETGVKDAAPVELDGLTEAEQARVLESVFTQAMERLGYKETGQSAAALVPYGPFAAIKNKNL